MLGENPYKDLEEILFTGFLTHPTLLGASKIPVLFKSLTEFETKQLDTKYFHIQDHSEKQNYYAAYSILQLNTLNVLPDRTEIFDELVQLVKDWPAHYFIEFYNILDSFHERRQKALDLLDTYVYTDTSRNYWFIYKNHLLNDPSITGWSGTEKLPLGSIHRRWVGLNLREDEHIDYMKHNDVARFIATAFHPTGMKKINEEALKERHEEVNRRRQAMELVSSGSIEEKPVDMGDPANMDGRQLAGLLDHMLSGELDDHDRMVAAHEKRIRKQYLEMKKASLAALDESTEKRLKEAGAPDTSRSTSREITPAELKARSERLSEGRSARASLQQNRAKLLSPDEKTATKLAGMVARLSPEEEALIKYDAFNPNQQRPDVPEAPAGDVSEPPKSPPNGAHSIKTPPKGFVEAPKPLSAPEEGVPEFHKPLTLEELRKQQGLE